MRINVKGVFLGCQIFGKYLVERGEGGSIINLGSMTGLVPLSRVFTYSASKAAVHQLTRHLGADLAPQHINVNAIAPGFIASDMTAELGPEIEAKILTTIPAGKYGQPEDIAGMVRFLAFLKISIL